MFDPAKYATATLVARSELSEDLWTIRIKADCDLPFRPGQYVTLGLPINGRMIERPYSIVSSPEEDSIELFIERVPEGEFSVPLYEIQVGGETAVRKRCKGLFLRDAPVEGRHHVLVSTVTGIAPFVSFVRILRARQERGEWTPTHRVLVLQGASYARELGYSDEMRRHAQEVDWLDFVPTISRPWEEPEWNGEVGRAEDVLRKHMDSLGMRPEETGVYLCGNPEMIANARGICRRAGFDDKNVHEEQYWPE